VVATRNAFVADLTGRRGWFTYDSQSNFVFTEPRTARGETGPDVARSAYEHLYARKVLVRYFPNHPRTASFLRISVGTDAEMAVLGEQLDAWARAGAGRGRGSPSPPSTSTIRWSAPTVS
jgi:histidinol-phosphate aminotransferase